MKIKEVNMNYILFDNGSRITFDHEQDCCETNYADFEQLEDLALEYEFENDLIFEAVPENGFRFGSKGTPMFFIPSGTIAYRIPTVSKSPFLESTRKSSQYTLKGLLSGKYGMVIGNFSSITRSIKPL